MNQLINHHPASFRDPSGFIYEKDGTVYRFVSSVYQPHYDQLQSSGLAAELIKQNLLLPFTEVNDNHTGRTDWYKTLQPQQIPFISYAWEWSFEQLKDAALATLSICKASLKKGMILKDASHTNIQFVDGKAKLIDTISFETYEQGESWIAYRQFCECFLNPLLLVAHKGLEVHKLLLSYPDGIPAQLTAKLLPFKTKLNPVVYLHVHLHAKLSGKKTSKETKATRKVSVKNIEQIIQSLYDCIKGLSVPETTTTWNNYYEETILSVNYLSEKKKLVSSLLEKMTYNTVIDLGANEGEFSLLCKKEALVIATDFDSACINSFYTTLTKQKQKNILPLVVDLTYPSPDMGWVNTERPAFFQSEKFDVGFALALIHHLAIGKNLSFEQLAVFFAESCSQLVIEFVPKEDPKVKEMLTWRKDIFENYTEDHFQTVFENQFELKTKIPVPGSVRVLYHFQKQQ
ncbi:MAG: SAM-dependent methyltransferase [Chitinophagaceae bacterium]|nr:SAM-dependent methyltransferase [Chitinophagaceae bacterium]